MKLYFASLYASAMHLTSNLIARLNEREKHERLELENILESYHYVHSQRYVDLIREDGTKIFLDSGAFSAFTQGVDVDINAYCQYIHRNMDIIKTEDGALLASVLDGIGDAYLTFANQAEMERQGIKPLPCFHYGEDERYLDWYVANYDYITLGGMVPISTNDLYRWLDRIWDQHLTDGSGRPKLKVHGFGITTVGIMQRYPWYSVDSSSWQQSSSNGSILLMPEARALAVSYNSPARKVAGAHIDNIPQVQAKALEDRLESEGFDMQRMRESYISRRAYNFYTYNKVAELTAQVSPKLETAQMDIMECLTH